jgi:hypothetical protein
MIIGFTGTRGGMTKEQREIVDGLLVLFATFMEPPIEAIHGDCLGADDDFDQMCKANGIPTSCLPCTFENMRAYCTEARAEPRPPMQRNRDIVAMADRMIACPPNFERIKKGSGTWATIGFAKKAGKPLMIVYPDGTMERTDAQDQQEEASPEGSAR